MNQIFVYICTFSCVISVTPVVDSNMGCSECLHYGFNFCTFNEEHQILNPPVVTETTDSESTDSESLTTLDSSS